MIFREPKISRLVRIEKRLETATDAAIVTGDVRKALRLATRLTTISKVTDSEVMRHISGAH